MARQVRNDGQADFRGGVNLAADPLQLASNEVRRAEEAVLTEFGGVTKRNGTQRLSDTPLHANGIQNGFAWLRADGTQQLLAVANGTLYTANYGIGTSWDMESGSLQASGAPSFAAFRASFDEMVYIADGGSSPSLNRWTGTALFTDLSGTPAVTQLAVYNQRLFGITGTNQTLYWSAINEGDTLGIPSEGGGEAIIRTFSDQVITGLASFRASLLIFHVSGISRFTGLTQDDIQISAGTQGVTGDVGTVAPRSIVATEQGVYFLSDRGFYVATESEVRPISLRLDPLIRSINLSQATNVVGVHQRATKEILWFVPGVGLLRYNYALDAWTGPCGAGYLTPVTTALWEAQDTNKQPIVLMGDAEGRVKRLDMPNIYKDNVLVNGTGGSSYTFAVECRRFFAGDPSNVKSFKWAYLMTNLRGASQAGLSWASTQGAGATTITAQSSAQVWGAGTWGSGSWGGVSTQPVRVPIGSQGQYLDLTITDSSNADSLWSRVELEGFDYGRRY